MDGRGRIMLPAPFRDLVRDELILMLWTENAVKAFTPETFNVWLQEHGTRILQSNALVLRRMIGSSTRVSVDDAHRLVIPPMVRSFMGYTTSAGAVFLVGTGDCFELWRPENFLAYAGQHFRDSQVREEAHDIGEARMP